MFCKQCQYDLQMLTEHRCPECGRAFDPENPNTYDIKPHVSKDFGIDARILTNISIFLAAGAVIALAAIWVVTWQEGRLDYVIRWMQNPEMYGNHSPWDRWSFANSACMLSSILMFAALMFAWCGLVGKRSAKSVFVMILIPILIYLLLYIHGPLVD